MLIWRQNGQRHEDSAKYLDFLYRFPRNRKVQVSQPLNASSRPGDESRINGCLCLHNVWSTRHALLGQVNHCYT